MTRRVQSWTNMLKFMIEKPKTTSLYILYPISRSKLASKISNTATELGLKTVKFEVNPENDFEEAPKYLSSILDNLKENDFLIVLRKEDFINKLKLNTHFNTYSGLTNGKGKSCVLHMMIDDSNLTDLCNIDYEEIYDYTLNLRRKLEKAKKIRIRTPIGTELTFHPRKWNVVPLKPDDEIKNALLPAGQVYTAPIENKTNGTIVIDRSISEFPVDFKDIIPFPEIKNEIKLKIQKGKIVEIKGDSEAKFLRDECLSKVDKNGWIVSEVTLGTNPRKNNSPLAAIQEVLRDTIHFGFGLNTHLGGDLVSNVHWDAVIEFDHEHVEIY